MILASCEPSGLLGKVILGELFFLKLLFFVGNGHRFINWMQRPGRRRPPCSLWRQVQAAGLWCGDESPCGQTSGVPAAHAVPGRAAGAWRPRRQHLAEDPLLLACLGQELRFPGSMLSSLLFLSSPGAASPQCSAGVERGCAICRL